MKEGWQEPLEYETSVDEMSSRYDFSSTNSDLSTKDSESSLEVMGVTLAQPTSSEGGVTQSQLQSMLSKDLEEDEKKAYMEMLQRHSTLFISHYDHITRVSVI